MPGAGPSDPIAAAQEQLRARITELAQSGSAVEEASELHHLAEAIAALGAVQPPIRRRRWPLVTTVAAILLLLTVGWLVRLRPTDVIHSFETSALDFTLATGSLVIPEAKLRSVQISEIVAASPPLRIDIPQPLFLATDPKDPASVVILDGLQLPPGAITITPIADSLGVLLRVLAPDAQVAFVLASSVQIGATERESSEQHLELPGQRMIVELPDEPVEIRLGVLRDAPIRFVRNLPITALSHLEDQGVDLGDRDIVRVVSHLEAGEVVFEALGGVTRTMRPGELLQLSSLAGSLRSLEWREGRLVGEFAGEADSIQILRPNNTSDLVPTLLEVTASQQRLALTYTAFAFLLGLVMGIERWLRS